jgi:regulatory protein
VRSRSPRKLATESELYAAALRALMRRAHSVHEMRQLLERRTESADDASAVLARLKQNKYLDDALFAAEFARVHGLARRQGRFRISRELRQRGVPDRHIEAALDAVFAETSEADLIRVRLKRKLASFRGRIDQRKAASLYRGLLRAGFSGDAVRDALRAARVDAAAIADIAESSPEEE